MLVGTFQNKIKKLNRNLRFVAPENQDRPVGLYYITDTECEHVCSTDRNDVPEHCIFDRKGHIVKSGWRRVLDILLYKRLTTKTKAECVFQCYISPLKYNIEIEKDPIARALEQLGSPTKTGIALKRDDLMDISKAIKKEQ